jgi:hypothetical protein
MMCDILTLTLTSKVMKQITINGLHGVFAFYRFYIMAWGVLDNGPLYCITFWTYLGMSRISGQVAHYPKWVCVLKCHN